jgi:hypothetical protein
MPIREEKTGTSIAAPRRYTEGLFRIHDRVSRGRIFEIVSAGVSGQGKRTEEELEILKVFQDRGIVIVVVDQKELERVAKGENFVSILPEKYEQVRLGLR